MAKKPKVIQYYEAVGRRKEAVAQVRLYVCGKDKKVMVNKLEIGKGAIIVNGLPIQSTFPSPAQIQQYLFPFKLTGSEERFAVSVKISGGGIHGQLEAMIHGISRALAIVDENIYRPTLKKHGLLTRDARVRERRKVGMGGKARRAKQSPKR